MFPIKELLLDYKMKEKGPQRKREFSVKMI